jgi:putative transcriptional regulator
MKIDLNFDFFKIDRNIQPSKGRMLISEPFLPDIYFRRSVIFLTEYSEEGSVGFILNKPTGLKIHEVINDFPEFDAEVSVGGPVANDTVHFCHILGHMLPDSYHVIDDIYWGGNFLALKKLISNGLVDANKIRFFIGYSGWSSKQLEREIEENSWLVTNNASWNIVSKSDKDAWQKVLKNLDEKYRLWSKYPENPILN